MNARNLELLSRLNPRPFYPRVDDKTLTKHLCQARGVPVPETYVMIERFGDLRKFPDLISHRQEFAVKPARGSGGRGILVVAGREGDLYRDTNDVTISLPEVTYHLSKILAGLYSLGGRPDRAIVEQRIGRHPIFETVAVGGTPDIRVVVYRGVPVMAMLRLSTRASRGRANLHQGAIGVGLDMESGRTRGGVLRGRPVTHHPDTGISVEGIEIPHWSRVLSIASQMAAALELGYLGVDLVLDPDRGPMVLETNARPGLAIQIANQSGLRPRLSEVDRELAENS